MTAEEIRRGKRDYLATRIHEAWLDGMSHDFKPLRVEEMIRRADEILDWLEEVDAV